MGNKESTFKQNVNIQEKIKELYSVVLQYLIGEGHKIDKTISFKNGYYNYTTGKKDDRCKECIELQKNEDKHKRKKECQACKLMKEDEEYKHEEKKECQACIELMKEGEEYKHEEKKNVRHV